jgi:hypothetical protein
MIMVGRGGIGRSQIGSMLSRFNCTGADLLGGKGSASDPDQRALAYQVS